MLEVRILPAPLMAVKPEMEINVIVHPYCRVDRETGFGVLDAAVARARAGGCPWRKLGRFRTVIHHPWDSDEGDQEVASKMECNVCRLKARRAAAFTYTEETESSLKLDLPSIE